MRWIIQSTLGFIKQMWIIWCVFSVKIRTFIHNFDEVGQKLYEFGQLVCEVGQLVYEVGQLLDGVSPLLDEVVPLLYEVALS